jgi:capsular exopolysaccharide synthesis family protein
MQQGKEVLIDFTAVFEILRNGRWRLFWLTIIGIVLSGYLAFVRMEPKYSATAVLALETQVQRIDGIQGVVSDMPLAGFSNELVLFTELEVFKSRFLMGKVVDELNLQNIVGFQPKAPQPGYLAYLFPDMNAPSISPMNTQSQMNYATDKLLKMVDIKLVPNSFAFHITAQSADPKQAQDIANSIANLYIDAQLQNKHHATNQATIWLANRVAELKLDLERNETRVREFDARTALLTEEDLQVREIKLKEMRARAVTMKIRHDQMLDTIMVQSDDPAVQFKSNDPTNLTNAALRGSKEFDRTKEQLAHLNNAISMASDQIYDQANDFQKLNQIRREAEASKNLYEFFLTRLKETSIQQGILRADSRMLSRAELPHIVTSASKTLMLLIGGLLGLMAGITVVFLRHGMRQNFQTSTELSNAFDLPVIGAIPKITKRRGLSLQQILDDSLNSFAGDAMRNLRAALIGKSNKPMQTLMLCSALSGEYKSTYAHMLSRQFATLGLRVLLLECDLRRVSLQTEFGAPDDGSLTDILQNSHPIDQAITRDKKLGFDILHAKGGSVNVADLLAGPEFSTMMAKLRAIYDVIVVDTPPVLLFPDARIVAQHCDQLILNVHAELTRHSDVQNALDILHMTQANIAGLVLANFDPRKQYGNRLDRERFRYNQPRMRA